MLARIRLTCYYPAITDCATARAAGGKPGPRETSHHIKLSSKAMSGLAGVELREKITQPLKFQWGTGGVEQPPPSTCKEPHILTRNFTI